VVTAGDFGHFLKMFREWQFREHDQGLNSLERIHATPCAGEQPSCGVVQLSNGFDFATDAQWNVSFASIDALVAAFTNGGLKCASPNELDFARVGKACTMGKFRRATNVRAELPTIDPTPCL
jgi:hypothetical protein